MDNISHAIAMILRGGQAPNPNQIPNNFEDRIFKRYFLGGRRFTSILQHLHLFFWDLELEIWHFLQVKRYYAELA